MDELRNNWLNPPEWTQTEVLEFPGSTTGPWARYVDPATVRTLGAGLLTPPLPTTAGLPESLETCGHPSAGSGDPRTAQGDPRTALVQPSSPVAPRQESRTSRNTRSGRNPQETSDPQRALGNRLAERDGYIEGIGTVRYPRLVPRDVVCAGKLKKRTLTNLYNERPTWLDLAHRKLDEAVFAAYGWPSSLTDNELLAKLLELNLERSGQEMTCASS